MSLPDLAPQTDPYYGEPFRVTLYSVRERRPMHSVYFLGNVPKAVIAAARRGKVPAQMSNPASPNHWPNTVWNAADSATLKSQYGPGWRKILIPDVGAVLDTTGTDPLTKTGGDEDFDFGNLGSLNQVDDEGAIIIDEAQLGPSQPQPGAFRERRGEAASPAEGARPTGDVATVYIDTGVYARDSLADLGDKIYQALGIPPVRQHLFWEVGDRVHTPYRFTSSRIPIEIDIRTFGQNEGIHISELPVDSVLAAVAERGEVFVEALDNFRLVGAAAAGGPLFHVYVCDFEELVAPRRRELSAVVGDRLQADLLYRGLALKYWPKFSLDAMIVYMRQGSEGLEELYPALAPHRPTLMEQLRIQDRLLGQMRTQQAAVYQRYATKRSLGVTSAIVQVEPYTAGRAGFGDSMRLNIRNIFNLFRTSAQWPAATARFFLNASAGGSWSRQDAITIKTHLSATPGGNDDSVEIHRAVNRTILRRSFMVVIRVNAPSPAPPPSGKQPCSTGLVGDTWLKGRGRLVYFTLRDDGAYTLESNWPEDQRMTPEMVVKALGDIIRPLVETINSMGILVFPTGGELYLPGGARSGSNFRVRGVTASAFWPRTLTDSAFRALKARWREYEQAGMVHIRGLQQAGAFAFQVTKGIVDYDPRAIERTIIVSTMSGPGGAQQTVREFAERTLSTYNYLTDPYIAQRWNCIYPGRTVRFFHRTSDLKIELVNVSDRELNWIWGLIFGFLDGLTVGSDKVPGIMLPNQAAQETGRKNRGGLRALQDRDPDLFDLRKYDSNATVYSVLCQNPRPPAVHSPEEAKRLPVRRQERLVKYWNFTENRPVYYECGHPSFPHLSFLDGRHPKGYGLPCCQKTIAHPGSRRERINQQFLELYAAGPPAEDEDVSIDTLLATEGSSRHVLAYGKRISAGRLASLARFFDEELFFQTLPDEADWAYRLWGVPQSLPALPQAGFFHAAAEIVGEEPAALGRKFAWAVMTMKESYAVLARGRVRGLFATPQHLSEAIIATFAPGDAATIFTPFSPGGTAHEIWEELVEELLQICYGVYLVVIEDRDGTTEQVTIDPRREVVDRLRDRDDEQIGVVFNIGQPEGKRGVGGIYPLVIQSPPAVPGGPKQITSLFGPGPIGGESARLLSVLREVLLSSENENPTALRWDLRGLSKLLRRKEFAGYQVAMKLVGRRDLCYGVVLKTGEHHFYVPVVASPHAHDDAVARARSEVVPAHYGPRSRLPAKYEPQGGSARDVLAFLNLVLKTPMGKESVRVAANLMNAEKTAFVGVSVSFDQALLNFYHAEVLGGSKTMFPHAPNVSIPIPPDVIDDALWGDPAVGLPTQPTPSPAALKGAYLASLFRLFLSEFASWVYRTQNAEVRAALAAAVQVADQSGEKNNQKDKALFEAFRKIVGNAIADIAALESDMRKLRAIVGCLRSRRLSTETKSMAEDFACMLKSTSFDFDIQFLHNLRIDTQEIALRRVRAVMDDLVTLMPIDAIVAEGHALALFNSGIYASCHDWPGTECGLPSPCVGAHPKKLAVPPDRYGSLLELLVAEVQNPLKWEVFIFQSSGVIDDLDFIRRPGERIEIRI